MHMLSSDIVADKEAIQTEKKMLKEQLQTKETELKAHESKVAKLLRMIIFHCICFKNDIFLILQVIR